MENKPVKILAVDDNPDNLISIRALIRESFPASKIITAANGETCMELARSEDPDVILLDVVMPGIDGFEVCRKLKADKALHDIPVIFITALKGDKEGRIKALEAGGEAFLAKPIDEAELTAQVMAMLRIKEARVVKRDEKKKLESLIDRRTRDLVKQLSEIKKSDEERKKIMAELLIAKEKAEQSDRLKSAFLANMSHEIRTPMNAIVGFSSMMSDPGLTNTQRDHFAGIIRARSDDLLHLVSDILEISQIESGNATVEKTVVMLNTLLVEVEADTRQRLERSGKRNIVVTFEKPLQHGSDIFRSDPYIIRQVLMKLLDNAFKFTTEGSVSCGYLSPQNGMITLYVSDTGIGISPANLQVIFETFRQGDTGDKPRFRGTGLGLAICKGLITLLGGMIEVASVQGKGTTFSVTIPFERVRHSVSASVDPILRPFGEGHFDWSGKRLLLVEDEESNMEFLRIILSHTKANLECVTTGAALRKCYPQLDQFHVVLLDVRLPDASGWDLAAEIKKLRPGLPVIAQTAYALSSDRRKSLVAGCDGYIAKPISKDRLLFMISEYL